MKSKTEKIVMKNALARAQHELKLSEKRIIAIAISKINSKASKLDYKHEPVSYTHLTLPTNAEV